MINTSKPYLLSIGEKQFEIGKVKNNIIHYNFNAIINYLNHKGKSLFGNEFEIHENDYNIIYKLCIHAIQDIQQCKKHGIDPAKGILLTGPVGCGKTSLMKLITFLLPNTYQYEVIPCREITFQFNTKGFDVITQYGNSNLYCFDDLGVEATGKHFGQDCNVMGEILLSRYELFVKCNKKTHITTNLNATELENRYGNRVRSRMRLLFNLIAFDENSFDKRS